jgi:hypothetical protein
MQVAILIAPCFDEPTQYTFSWSREVVSLLQEKGYNVIDIGNREVSRAEVEEALKQNPNVLYIHYDHGTEDAHWGSRSEKVIDLDNVQLLSHREVYCLNCLSAKKLGVEAYKLGAIAYWGYVQTFIFTTDAIEEFKQFANSGIKFKLEGHSWEECLELAKNFAKQLSEKLIKEGKYIASITLEQDADALRCYTEKNPPKETECFLRKIALKLFGFKFGWLISRKHALSLILFGLGIGLFLHDRIIEWVILGRRIHGLDIGFILTCVAYVILTFDFIKWLKKSI